MNKNWDWKRFSRFGCIKSPHTYFFTLSSGVLMCRLQCKISINSSFLVMCWNSTSLSVHFKGKIFGFFHPIDIKNVWTLGYWRISKCFKKMYTINYFRTKPLCHFHKIKDNTSPRSIESNVLDYNLLLT